MSSTATSRPAGSLAAAILGSFRQPGFVACVLTLGVFTASFYGLTRKMRLRKLPAPLQLPLGKLDKAALYRPYRFADAKPIHTDVLDALGTKEYIQWILIDEDRKDDEPTKRVSLFITYYTGQPDPVPHIPENCYLAGGYQILDSKDDVFHVPELRRDVPVRVLELEKRSRMGVERPIVAYLFGVNGGFAIDRNEVRTVISRPWEPYSYFSKVEARFESLTGTAPTSGQALEAAKRLFSKLVPILVKAHWPDWKALHEKPAPARP